MNVYLKMALAQELVKRQNLFDLDSILKLIDIETITNEWETMTAEEFIKNILDNIEGIAW